jgi:hypothetical protein
MQQKSKSHLLIMGGFITTKKFMKNIRWLIQIYLQGRDNKLSLLLILMKVR